MSCDSAQGSAAGPAQPWRATGAFLVGVAGHGTGSRYEHLVGAVSDVRTWRGALTAAQVAQVHGGNPAVRQLSQWNLDGQGTDLVGGRTLTFSGAQGVDYDWVEDQHCRPWRALGLRMTGTGHARTAGPVLTTDESLTVTAWVKLDALVAEHQTVLSQGGGSQPALALQVTPTGAWRFAMAAQDTAGSGFAGAESPAGAARVGEWTHLAGVFDLARGELRLYVDGAPAGTAAAVAAPWHAAGPLFVGASGRQDGHTWHRLRGSVDTVTAWSSTLDPDRIADLGARSPLSGGPC